MKPPGFPSSATSKAVLAGEIDNRVAEYAFKQTETDREINSKGELKKETVKVYEVYPLPNREPVEKFISENGVPLSPERAAKEDRRVQEDLRRPNAKKKKTKRRWPNDGPSARKRELWEVKAPRSRRF